MKDMKNKIIKNNKGFTLIELIIGISLLAFILAVSISFVNINVLENKKKNIQSRLLSNFSIFESALNSYLTTKNEYPSHSTNLLLNSTFVPTFIMPPQIMSEFDQTYGLNGFLMFNNTNGYYVCARTHSINSSSEIYKSIKKLSDSYPTKIFLNTTCGSLTNMADPSINTQIIITYWINRF